MKRDAAGTALVSGKELERDIVAALRQETEAIAEEAVAPEEVTAKLEEVIASGTTYEKLLRLRENRCCARCLEGLEDGFCKSCQIEWTFDVIMALKKRLPL